MKPLPIINLILCVTFFVTPYSRADQPTDEPLREGEPKACFLFSWGKGPNWFVKVPTEFRLQFLNTKRPYVDDSYEEPTTKALTWIERDIEPEISHIARIDKRTLIQVVYPAQGLFGREASCIMLAMETAPSSDWFAPFFVVQPELFRGQIVSSNSIRAGYVASLEFSGTGALRTHYLFDLTKAHPSLIDTVSAGRVRSIDFETNDEYQKALNVFSLEQKLLDGIPLNGANPSSESNASESKQ